MPLSMESHLQYWSGTNSTHALHRPPRDSGAASSEGGGDGHCASADAAQGIAVHGLSHRLAIFDMSDAEDNELPSAVRIAARRERELSSGVRLASSAPADLTAWPTIAAAHECLSEGAAAASTAAEPSDTESEEEGVLCAICHSSIQPQEAALVRGCDHPFCCGCILNWALQKPRCPLCQLNFTHVWLYRQLDGTYNDFLIEESVDMLHQTYWFKKKVSSEFTPALRALLAQCSRARPGRRVVTEHWLS